MHLINWLLPTLEHFRMLGYWIVFAVAVLESLAFIGLLIPGTAFVLLVGFLSTQGYFDVVDLIWITALGAMVGDGISYVLGKKGTSAFNEKNRFFSKTNLEKAEIFFKHHGNKSIFLGRFIGPIRPIIPFVAGMSRMLSRKFFFWNVISAFCWAISYVLVGYFFGATLHIISRWTVRIEIILGAMVLTGIIVYVWRRWKKKRENRI